jgi:hypothetical protein
LLYSFMPILPCKHLKAKRVNIRRVDWMANLFLLCCKLCLEVFYLLALLFLITPQQIYLVRQLF